jgi:hypothetical protein
MALSEATLNDKIEVLNLAAGYPVVQVRTATIIKRDDVEISRSFHRRVVTPGDDFLSEEPDVLAIVQAVFTAESQAAYAAAQQGEE